MSTTRNIFGVSLSVILLAAAGVYAQPGITTDQGAITRGDRTQRKLALVFTGDEFAEGGPTILATLKRNQVKASFFFTGRFYRNPSFKSLIKQLKKEGHYLGAHSDQHLLYCDWTRRDRLLVTRDEFEKDLNRNYEEMLKFGIKKKEARYFLPPFEWYNQRISDWTSGMGIRLINYTPGTRSHADYTTPDLKNYIDSETILRSIENYEAKNASGLNGFILLSHIGAGPARTDKFYDRLDELIEFLKGKEYELVRIDELLKRDTHQP